MIISALFNLNLTELSILWETRRTLILTRSQYAHHLS